MLTQVDMTNWQERDLPFSHLGRRLQPPAITRLMNDALSRPGLISLAAGFTSAETLPVVEVASAVSNLLSTPSARDYLQYGLNAGRPLLRKMLLDRLVEHYQEDGLKEMNADQVILTNGSQQALYLAMQVLCNPGDRVLVEAPTYFVFLELLTGLGIEPISIPAKDDGTPDFPGLMELLASWRKNDEWHRLKAVYLVTYFANPSTRSWTEGEKLALAGALNAMGAQPVLLEDAAYRDLYFDAPHPARSWLSLPECAKFPAVYFGTFTKPLATGLKVGYALTPCAPLLKKMQQLKGHHDFGSAHFPQAIVESILAGGLFEPLLAANRRFYRRKMDAFATALRQAGLPALGWRWSQPAGGILLWARAPDGLSTDFSSPFYQCCLEENLLYVPGDLCFAEGRPHHSVRLSIGALQEEQMHTAAQTLAKATSRILARQ